MPKRNQPSEDNQEIVVEKGIYIMFYLYLRIINSKIAKICIIGPKKKSKKHSGKKKKRY